MDNEVKEKLEVRKTVPINAHIPKRIHKRLKIYWGEQPKDKKFADVIAETLDLGLKSINR